MPTLVLETLVDAPVEVVFDLARHAERHADATGDSERPVDGTTNGHLELGDVVTRRDRHFGVPVELTVQVTQMDSPTHFRDKQVDGPFAELTHDHYFERTRTGGTRMVDEFSFSSPLGPLGSLVDRYVLRDYVEDLLEERNQSLRSIAEDGSG